MIKNRKLKFYLIYPFLFLLALGSTILIVLTIQLYAQVQASLERKDLFVPQTVLSDPALFDSSNRLSRTELNAELEKRNYKSLDNLERLTPGQFFSETSENCSQKMTLDENSKDCLWIWPTGSTSKSDLRVVLFDSDEQMQKVLSQQGPAQLILDPMPIAQKMNNQLILYSPKKLSEVPPQCLFAVLAIEDQNFLTHPGVSWKGLSRALFNNLTGGRKQGGSTITQQLVKNDILTPERTFERKFKELIMSVILEHKLSKDEIFEKYLNVIYFGQNGPYQVRGLGAASQFYFDKELESLNLTECSLLAAILNSPGLFDPSRKAEAATKRRNLVLQK